MRLLERIEYFTDYPWDGMPYRLPYRIFLIELQRAILDLMHQIRPRL